MIVEVRSDNGGVRRYRLPLDPQVPIGRNGWVDLRFLFRNGYHRRWTQEQRRPHTTFLGEHYPLPPPPVKGAETLGQKERWEYNIANACLVQDVLSPRQQQVLQFLADGKRNREIAAKLYISEATVHYHLRQIFTNFGVRKRTQAVAVAWRVGLIE